MNTAALTLAETGLRAIEILALDLEPGDILSASGQWATVETALTEANELGAYVSYKVTPIRQPEQARTLHASAGSIIAVLRAENRAAVGPDEWETACSCGGDPDTCPANQAVIAQIAADEGQAEANRT
jgi:hypothetical protein